MATLAQLPWRKKWIVQDEVYFLIHLPRFIVKPNMPSEHEMLDLAEFRWWRVADLTAAPDQFAPRALPRLVHELIHSGPPAEIVDAGI